ncbi:Protein N-acetyltransferase, RimJ/RimL family [Spirosomataceae bacterium TFI 002]|nr:Protein N-acetyltransferase, RimJ/RimL family [Spirosomataceae bacterium TFI 002]
MNPPKRLVYLKPSKEDFDRFYEIHSDPETNLFNPNGAMNEAKAEQSYATLLDHWDKYSFGTWCISEKANPAYVIGFGGLDHRPYGTELKLNLGYRFDKKFWGKGYATELANHVIDHGFSELGKKEIFAIVRPNHLASIKVLEKCNMKLIDELNDVPNKKNSLIYQIHKAAYIIEKQ